jgi:hypothetical protein
MGGAGGRHDGEHGGRRQQGMLDRSHNFPSLPRAAPGRFIRSIISANLVRPKLASGQAICQVSSDIVVISSQFTENAALYRSDLTTLRKRSAIAPLRTAVECGHLACGQTANW